MGQRRAARARLTSNSRTANVDTSHGFLLGIQGQARFIEGLQPLLLKRGRLIEKIGFPGDVPQVSSRKIAKANGDARGRGRLLETRSVGIAL